MSSSVVSSQRQPRMEPQIDNIPKAMRLKVLYTFDAERRENRLSRWPQMIQTPIVYIEPDRVVGIVELRTCLSSIAASSPELVATLGTNYSVYAFDYSEPDIPMVGLGILSWLLAAPSSQPYVTGLVSSNPSPIFQGSVKETLEVRFCLTPVPNFTQEDYLKSMSVYNALSKQIPGSFDPIAWSAFVTANPQVLETAQHMQLDSPSLSRPSHEQPVNRRISDQQDQERLERQERQERQDRMERQERQERQERFERQEQERQERQERLERLEKERQMDLRHHSLRGQFDYSTTSTPHSGPMFENFREPSPIDLPSRNTARSDGFSRCQSTVSQAATTDLNGFTPMAEMASSPPSEGDASAADLDEPSPDPLSPLLPAIQDVPRPANSRTVSNPVRNPTGLILPGMVNIENDVPSPMNEGDGASDSGATKKPKAKRKYTRKNPLPVDNVASSDAPNGDGQQNAPQPRKRGRPPGSTKEKALAKKAALQEAGMLKTQSSAVGQELIKVGDSVKLQQQQLEAPKQAEVLKAQDSENQPNAQNQSDASRADESKKQKEESKKQKEAATKNQQEEPEKAGLDKPGKRPRTARASAEKKSSESNQKKLGRSSSTTGTVKERIERQLAEALKEGKVPNYCGNCGAIETSTWRRVTTKNVAGADPKEEMSVLLCNPCGLWHHAKGTMRPQEFWDSRPRDMDDTNRKPRNRKRKASNAPLPMGPMHQVDGENDVEMKAQRAADNDNGSRKVPCTPSSRHSRAADEELWGTSHTDKTVKPRASSPTREGTAESPIELDDDKEDDQPIERSLFGPSKGAPLEESPRINMHPHNDQHHPRPRSRSREAVSPSARASAEKENRPPQIIERSVTPAPGAEETVKGPVQFPRTPDRRQNSQHMQTPSKLTPLRDSPWRSLFGMSPKIDSPSSATIKRLLSHINSMSPTKAKGTASANASPLAERLPRAQRNQSGEVDEDMFSTDIIMPSSPPAFGFSTDKDGQMPSSMWTDLLPSPKDMEQFTLDIFGGLDNITPTKKTPDLTVDFSTFIAESEKMVTGMGKEKVQEEVAARSSATPLLELPAPPVPEATM
ncbi:hypothetical protein BJ508DRAFT_308100 [Ascobolus immersus RN42]|uniref:GATA-type domain-containing protein n=1 Tax=Ascobolus immersus RN42 TaxID=1160509 RepID=A0A3N4I141_ASCIM|nr:hypothetical protein BJ508DRAFT_308100 [Ascobolus immersus RN42]